ncbi:hypothetical protein L2E82_17358 [Cichorium intybus]|uniref:Uncharacterized protein n=1 Tax=Cichorium intybus TaxID=13427 RepID=A0ACB9F824_CICIN|nr:hypothetical protein L2E82_17358 [Cichorium intybus]
MFASINRLSKLIAHSSNLTALCNHVDVFVLQEINDLIARVVGCNAFKGSCNLIQCLTSTTSQHHPTTPSEVCNSYGLTITIF